MLHSVVFAPYCRVRNQRAPWPNRPASSLLRSFWMRLALPAFHPIPRLNASCRYGPCWWLGAGDGGGWCKPTSVELGGGVGASGPGGLIEGRGSDWQGYRNNHEERGFGKIRRQAGKCDDVWMADGRWTGAWDRDCELRQGQGLQRGRQVFSNRQGDDVTTRGWPCRDRVSKADGRSDG